MKEKLLTNYGETMKLKADTGNSYCESSGSGPLPQKSDCFFKFRKITLHPLSRWNVWSRHEGQSHLCWYAGLGVSTSWDVVV